MAGTSYGEGTVFEDKKQPGRWYGFVELGRDENGRRLRKKVTGTSKREVRARLRELTVARHSGKLRIQPRPAAKPVLAPGKSTGAWLTFWLEQILPGTVAPRTAETYRQIVKDWVSPYV